MDPSLIIYLISRIHEEANRIIIRELKSNNLRGLVPSHGDILMMLFKNNRVSMKEIAASINRKKTTVTVLVEKLIRAGYVKKEIDENDKRYCLISLTRKGRSLKNILINISNTLIARVYGEMPESDRKTLMQLLYQIYQTL